MGGRVRPAVSRADNHCCSGHAPPPAGSEEHRVSDLSVGARSAREVFHPLHGLGQHLCHLGLRAGADPVEGKVRSGLAREEDGRQHGRGRLAGILLPGVARPPTPLPRRAQPVPERLHPYPALCHWAAARHVPRRDYCGQAVGGAQRASRWRARCDAGVCRRTGRGGLVGGQAQAGGGGVGRPSVGGRPQEAVIGFVLALNEFCMWGRRRGRGDGVRGSGATLNI